MIKYRENKVKQTQFKVKHIMIIEESYKLNIIIVITYKWHVKVFFSSLFVADWNEHDGIQRKYKKEIEIARLEP